MEQMTGVEPALQPWQGRVLPLNYICKKKKMKVIYYIIINEQAKIIIIIVDQCVLGGTKINNTTIRVPIKL